MIKKAAALILSMIMMISVSGCGYDDYANAKREFAQTESIRMENQTTVVMEAMKILMSGFEKAAEREHKGSPMFEKEYVDANGQTVKETVYSNTGEVFAFMTEYRRPEIIRELVPMIEHIYKQQQLDMEAPVTSGEVAKAFVNQIPFMSAMAGMYALGAAGLDAAGDNINATVSNGSSFANNGGTASSDFTVTNGEGSVSMDNNFTDDNSWNDNRQNYNNTTEQVK